MLRYLRIDSQTKKVTWGTGNDLQVLLPDEGEQEGEQEGEKEEKKEKGGHVSLLKPVKGQSFRALTIRDALLLPLGYLRIGGRAYKVTWDCSASSGDMTCESLPVSHLTLLARLSIRRYPKGRRRAPLATLRGDLLLPFGYLRIDGRTNKVTWDMGNDLRVV